MYFKKFLNQPNLVGTVMIALLIGSGFIYTFAFHGFNVETVPGAEVEIWIAQAEGGEGYGEDDDDTPEEGDPAPDGEAPKCDCRDCSCGNKVWKQGGKKNKWGWWKPCGGQNKEMPCKGNCPYNSHSGSESNCPCPNHPDHGRRETWKVCNDSTQTTCDGNCKPGKKQS